MSVDDVLTPEAVEFLHVRHRKLSAGRDEVLAARVGRAQRLRDGELPDFLEETPNASTPKPPSRTSAPLARSPRPPVVPAATASTAAATARPTAPRQSRPRSQQPQLRIVERVTIAFLDHYLKQEPLRQLLAAGAVPGIAQLTSDP